MCLEVPGIRSRDFACREIVIGFNCGFKQNSHTAVSSRRGLTIRSTGPIAAGRHLGYKSLAQIPAHRNRPVSSNVRPHILKTVPRHRPRIQNSGSALFLQHRKIPKGRAPKECRSASNRLARQEAARTVQDLVSRPSTNQ